MGFRMANLWRWDGTVERGTYALVGLVGLAIKYNLDRLVARVVFDRPWTPANYLVPGHIFNLASPADVNFCLGLLAVALPFIWIGVVLTVQRLRSAELPRWLVILFFVPLVQWLFLALLCLWPSRHEARPPRLGAGGFAARLEPLIPENALGAAAFGVAVTGVLGLGAAAVSVKVFTAYGFGLFVLVPFCVGLVAVLLYGYRRPRSCGSCILVALLAAGLLGAALLAVAFEGLICLLMAAPIGGALAILGGLVGYVIQQRPWCRPGTAPAIGLTVLVVPLLIGTEQVGPPAAPVFAVRTALVIHAPREQVWHNVVTFAQLPPPTEWLFRCGIAYPQRAEINGRGVGAVRQCVFSTGAFTEPIEVWDEPQLLKFSVTSNPAPMAEWTPYAVIHPPHLDGFLMSRGGQFRLSELPNGDTHLEGTTWYQHHLWPAQYWRWWSDFIIHRIHLRVLRHIQRCAESGGGPRTGAGCRDASLTVPAGADLWAAGRG